LVESMPVTGRTNQIILHTLHSGHAIAGDTKYGDENFSREISDLGGKRLFLHANILTVPMPDGSKLNEQASDDDKCAK
ncbi:23S rRNA pseudouridine(955/2504/2580) synthase, partial [Pseudomonas syringae pv. tagetis]